MKAFRQTVTIAVLLTSAFVLRAQSNLLAQPLPSLDLVLPRVIEQSGKESANEHTFKQHYSYTRTRVTEYRNSDGDLKNREEKLGDKKPNPITVTNTPATASSNSDAQKREHTFEKSDLAMLGDIIDRFQLTLVRRDIINGRATVVVDFKPKSRDLPEHNLKDRFINHAAGRVWVDEADGALVKLNLHLTETVTVFGGLVGAVWKFTCVIERGRTEDGLWFLRRMNWHLEGREVLVNKYVDYNEQWTNVRKTQ